MRNYNSCIHAQTIVIIWRYKVHLNTKDDIKANLRKYREFSERGG